MVRSLSQKKHAHVLLGIGDDAAIFKESPGRQIYSIDSAVEGVHFKRPWLTPAELAYRSFAAAVSDLSAMGAQARGFLCHISLPENTTRVQMQRFFSEQQRFSQDFACPLIGGNISRASEWSIVTNVIGQVLPPKLPLLRSGAQVGNEVWLVGDLGKSRLGLSTLLKQASPVKPRFHNQRAKEVPLVLQPFLKPPIYLTEGQRLVGCASACLDISDGLCRDASRLASASQVRVRLSAAALMNTWAPEWNKLAKRFAQSPLDFILTGGEDYALLATGPAAKRPAFARPIGEILEGPGLLEVELDGSLLALPEGHCH